MRWIPKVEYDEGRATLRLTLPQNLWVPGSTAVGGSETSAAGVPESFVIRRDQTLDVRLRLRESEWPAVHAWLAWMQDTAGSCRFFPDRDALDGHPCYLQSPGVGDEIRPERGEYPGTYEIALRLRSTLGTEVFDVRAYE